MSFKEPVEEGADDEVPGRPLPPLGAWNTKVTDELRAKIIELHRQGLGDRRVGKAVGLSKVTVYRVLQVAGLKGRPPHPAHPAGRSAGPSASRSLQRVQLHPVRRVGGNG